MLKWQINRKHKRLLELQDVLKKCNKSARYSIKVFDLKNVVALALNYKFGKRVCILFLGNP